VSAIRLSPYAATVIRHHAASAYPYECCGALIGTRIGQVSDVVDVRQLVNVTSEGPRRRFLVSAEDYRACETYAARVGAELLGFYHSHPDHPAEPSQYDLDHAWPNFSYVIISVRAGAAGDLRSWRLRPDRSGFVEETREDVHAHENSDSHAVAGLYGEEGRR
jgi:proteasome lid subunit RPN8/RPN11